MSETTRAARAPLPIAPVSKPVPVDKATAEARKTARQYPFTTVILPWRPNVPSLLYAAEVADGLAAMDAANECAHGWLLSDTPPEQPENVAKWNACREAGCVVAQIEQPARVEPVEPKRPAISTADVAELTPALTGALKPALDRDSERNFGDFSGAPKNPPAPSGLAGVVIRRLEEEVARLTEALARVRRTHADSVKSDSNGGRDGS